MLKTEYKKNIKDLLKLLVIAEIKPTVFLVSVTLALLAALFEGTSFGLLIPTIKGIIEGNAHFVKNLPYLGHLFNFIPEFLKDRSIKIFSIVLFLTLCSVILKNLFNYLSQISIANIVWSVSNNLRKKIFKRYLTFGKLYFDENNTGKMQERLSGYTKQIAHRLTHINQTIYYLFVLGVYLLIMFNISFSMTVCVLLIAPFFQLLMGLIIEKVKHSSESYIKVYNNLVKKLSNVLVCIPLVKLYLNEEKEYEKFQKESDLVKNHEFSIDKKLLIIPPLNEIIMIIILFVLVSYMAFLIYIRKEGDIAGFTVFFLVLKRSMGGFASLSHLLAEVASIRGPLTELLYIFNDEEKYFTSEGKKIFNGINNSIEIKNLNYNFREKIKVLNDLNLKIEKGKMTAIVGPTGSGKSTLINLIMRFYDPPSDTIFLDGKDIKNFTLNSYYEKVSLVAQDSFLFNDSLKENLIYGLKNVSESEIQNALEKSQLKSLLEKLPDGINTEIGDRGVKLSGGEKQRLSIARSVLKNAEILILDEATSSVDSVTEKLIQNAIDEATLGKTSIVIAHRLSTIKHADKIVVLKDGKIVEEGNLESLLNKKGEFYHLWEKQKFY